MQYHRFFILFFLATASRSTCQEIKISVPVAIDASYQYTFLPGNKYIMGMPMSSGILSNRGKCGLWEAKSGKFIHSFENSGLSNYSSTFSPDGRYFAISPNAGQMLIGDVQSDKITDTLAFHASVQLSMDVKFSPTGNYLVYNSSYLGEGINIYNLEYKHIRKIQGICDMSRTKFSKDGKYVCFFNLDYTARIFQLSQDDSGKTVHLPEAINETNPYLWTAFSNEDNLIQVFDAGTLWLINTKTNTTEKIPQVLTVLAAKQGQITYVSSQTGQKELINYDWINKQAKVLTKFAGNFQLSANGNILLLRQELKFPDFLYTAFDWTSGKPLWDLGQKYTDEYVTNLDFSPNGKYYVIRTSQFFYVFETATRTQLQKIRRSDLITAQTAVFFSGNEKLIGFKDETTINICNPETGIHYGTLQTGGNFQNYTITGFDNDSRNFRINTYGETGLISISLDSACILTSEVPATSDVVSPDKKYFLRFNAYGNLSLFDAAKNSEIRNILLDISGFTSAFSPKGGYFLVYEPIGKMYAFESRTGRQLWVKDFGPGFLDQPLAFDRNDHFVLVTTSAIHTAYDWTTGSEIGHIDRKNWLTPPIIDETSAYIYLVDSSGLVRVFSAKFGLKPVVETVTSPAIKDLHFTLFADSFRCLRVGSYGAGRFTDSFPRSDRTPANYDRGNFLIKESADHRYLLAYYAGDQLELWDLIHKKLDVVIPVPDIQVANIYISPDNRRIIIQGMQKELHLYDRQARSFVATFFLFNGPDKQLAVIRNDGFYKIDKGIANYLRFNIDGISYDFDQLDLRYNRPDKILTALGNSDTSLIAAYRLAYIKRVENLGLDTATFSKALQVPVATLVNEDELTAHSSPNSRIVLKVRVYDKIHGQYLQRIYVTANGNPILGEAGWNISMFHTTDTLVSISLDLAAGNNLVKISCLNNQGVESYRSSVNIDYTPTANRLKPQTWFIGVGVSKYENSAYDLLYPTGSIRRLDSFFSVCSGANYAPVLFLDTMATKKNILALKQRLLAEVRPDDRIVLAFSGHGKLDTLNGQREFYYATRDMDFDKPSAKGLSYQDIDWLLDSVPAQNKLVIIDACHSGQLDRKRTNDEEFELMQDLFANTSRGNGATVIAASAGTKFAYEPEGLGTSRFIGSILTGLGAFKADLDQDGSIHVQELQEYVNKQVSAATNQLQKPVERVVNYDNDWIIR